MKLIDTDKFMKFIGALQEAGAEHISFDNLERFVNEQAVELDVEELEKYSVSNICRGRECNGDEFCCEHCGAAGMLEIIKERLRIE
nr:hypothetical protein [uncultured Acetatifactor sp.]